MKILILHHVKPYHLDDYLAVSLLLHKHKNDNVKRIEVRNEKEIEEILNSEKYDIAYVIDIGRKYEVSEKIRFYDHHHDIKTPCSLILVLKHELPQLWEKIQKIEKLKKLIEYIDLRDRFGVKEVNKVLGIVDPINVMMYLPSVLMTEPSVTVGESFVKLIEMFAKVTETTKIYEIDNVKIAVNYADPREVLASIVFEVLEPDILIQRNVREPDKISIIKNQYSSLYNKINLERLNEILPVTFIHPSKFMCVVAKRIEEIESIIQQIVELVFK